MSVDDPCPRCGTRRAADAPGGFCPECLLRLGLGADLSDGSRGEVTRTAGPPRASAILTVLGGAVGPLQSVLLRDTPPGEEPSPVVRPSSPEMPGPADRPARLQLLGEIARGGMGAVLKGRDTDLGRDLAVKVLLEQHRDRPEMVRRFVEEAQIGGQLQHPGIVPVYELGTFPDARPFFAMKLVKGRTLADLLAARSGPADDLPRFLGIFEQVCQTMSYAHARGVIHRDLKPSNVMVGAFGEVQVMDWGLAKVLESGGVADDERTVKRRDESAVQTTRSGSGADASQAGSVLGTPSYMPPEQARGEITWLDERGDVFGLGAILCEILTGDPPYVGRSIGEVQRKAARAELDDAMARLDACGAEPELSGLARLCLAAEPRHRPREAGEVALAMGTYLNGVQQRLRQAELARVKATSRAEEEAKRRVLADELAVEAQARAKSESRRRRLAVVLAASVVVLVVTIGGGSGWLAYDRQRRAGQVELLLSQADLLNARAAQGDGDVAGWAEAMAAARRVEPLLADARDVATRRRIVALIRAAEEGTAAAGRDQALLALLVDIRSARADDPDGSATDASYADAFRDAGIDVDALSPKESGARIAGRPAAVVRALVAALDDWTAVRMGRGAKAATWSKLVAAARAADPDPDRATLRSALLIDDRAKRLEAVRPLSAREDAETWSPASLLLLANTLSSGGDMAGGVAVLRRASGAHPRDALVHHGLGMLLDRVRPPQPEEKIRALSVGRALQPELGAHDLAVALEDRGRGEEAEAVWRDLVRHRPDVPAHLTRYGKHLKDRGRVAEARSVLDRAVVAYRKAIQLKPGDAVAYGNLGTTLWVQGKPDEAIAACREAIRLKPAFAWAHNNLGVALKARGKPDEAIAAYREAIRLEPSFAGAHNNLGVALRSQGKPDEAIAAYREAIRLKPDDAFAYDNLGNALQSQGKPDEAIAAHREAIRLKPDHAQAHTNLGRTLSSQGKLGEAIVACREAIRLKPDHGPAYNTLGVALKSQGKPDEAIAAYREAIRLEPDHAQAHSNLGAVLESQGKPDEAIAACREAIRLDPAYVEAHYNLGNALRSQGKLDEAIAAYREAIRLKPGLVEAHNNLGFALRLQGKLDEAIAAYREAIRLDHHHAHAYSNLGLALKSQGKLDEAIVAFREAIRLKPDDAQAYSNLGNALWTRGKTEEAVAALREAIRLRPDDGVTHSNLGVVLWTQGKPGEAVAAYREAIRLKPDYAEAHYHLGNALWTQGKLDEAIAAYREAIRLKPDHAEAYDGLGIVLQNQWKPEEALAAFRRAVEVARPGSRVARSVPGQIRALEQRLALVTRLAAVLGGDARPKDAAELIAFGQICYDQGRHADAARLWADALAADPNLADDLRAGHRYNAACAAALAGSGKSKGDPPPDEAARAGFRTRARDWLRADLAVWATRLDAGPDSARKEVQTTLAHWKVDRDLTGVRASIDLVGLPADEQEAWRDLWKDVDALLKKAGGRDRP
jgi:tetratricopeptide (TPR) repeat protein